MYWHIAMPRRILGTGSCVCGMYVRWGGTGTHWIAILLYCVAARDTMPRSPSKYRYSRARTRTHTHTMPCTLYSTARRGTFLRICVAALSPTRPPTIRSTGTVSWKPWERLSGGGATTASTTSTSADATGGGDGDAAGVAGALDVQPWRLFKGVPATVCVCVCVSCACVLVGSSFFFFFVFLRARCPFLSPKAPQHCSLGVAFSFLVIFILLHQCLLVCSHSS